ncbi:MAG: hypothetical protein AB1767_04625 [Bacillota bacterium]
MEKKVKLSRKCRHGLLKKPNVVGVGVGYREKEGKRTENKSIVVFVTEKVARHELRNTELVPPTLKGRQVDVIEIGEIRLLDEEEEPHERKNGTVTATPDHLKRYRPAPGGVSIGHYKITAGTLGAVVRDKRSGARLILSNNHVLANTSSGNDGRASIGDAVLQPGVYDGGKESNDLIGRLARFIPMQRTLFRSECATAAAWERAVNRFLSLVRPQYQITLQRENEKGNLVDAALAAPLQETDLSDEVLGLGKIMGVAEAYLGQQISFSGRTSGLVSGKVIAEDVSLYITMNPGEHVLFDDQLITTAVSRPGDSGSLVMDRNNKAVGLLFAGSDKVSICNRINNVCRLLDIEF